jgi:hypothetical protein
LSKANPTKYYTGNSRLSKANPTKYYTGNSWLSKYFVGFALLNLEFPV